VLLHTATSFPTGGSSKSVWRLLEEDQSGDDDRRPGEHSLKGLRGEKRNMILSIIVHITTKPVN